MAANYANRGLIYKARGELDRARESWTRACDLFEEIGIPDKVAQVEEWLSELGE